MPFCYYCGEETNRSERDHAPIPKRHGGHRVVTTCIRCHDLKDRIRFQNWPKELQVAVQEVINAELPWPANIAMFKMLAMLCDQEIISLEITEPERYGEG